MSPNNHEKERYGVNIASYLKRAVKIAPYKRAVIYPTDRAILDFLGIISD
jgi:hypothetical protein